MNALEKLKLTGRLKAAVDMRNVEKNPLKKLKAAKEVQDLRWQLGLIGGVAKVPDNKLDESSLRPLNVPENATAKEVRKALEDYLKQLQGKTIITVDGKTVRFSKQTTRHISQDSAIDKAIVPEAVAHVVEVFKSGEFIERQESYKERNDFVAFHTYRKWIDLNDKSIYMQVKAAELADGSFEAGNGILAYSAKDVTGKENEDAVKTPSFTADSANDTAATPGINLSAGSSTTGTSAVSRGNNHTAVFDEAQDNPYIFVEILEVRRKAAGSETKSLQPRQAAQDAKALYAFDDTRTKAARQKDNNAVFALLDKIDSGEVKPADLTDADKAALAKYSGSGGGLKARDGKTGSAHEYYTPAPVAEAMWAAKVLAVRAPLKQQIIISSLRAIPALSHSA